MPSFASEDLNIMRLFSQIGLAVVLAGLAASGAWMWTVRVESKAGGDDNGQRERQPVLVETAPVRLGTVTETVEVVGTTRARNAIDVVATTAGQITRINFEAGQQLAENDLLVEIDAASEQAAVLEAESALDNLRRQLDRSRTLLNRKLSSTAEVDDLAAQVRVAEARLAAARSRLDKRFIRAPFAGVVGLRNISVGDYVDSDTVLTTLDDLSTVELDFEVPEKYFGTIERGQKISAISIAFPDRSFAGSVRDIDTRISTTTRSFRVRAELPNPEALLPEGLFMTASLIIIEHQDALLIPEEAVVAEGEERYVFVINDATAQRLPVVTGIRSGAEVEVISGLSIDAEVVTKGHQKLRDKAPVRLAQQNPEKPAENKKPAQNTDILPAANAPAGGSS
jgi:membrane fusion protein (multidrug efflux system)